MRYGSPTVRVEAIEDWMSLSEQELLATWNNPDHAMQYADVVSAGIQLYQRLGKERLIELTRGIPFPVMVSGTITGPH